MLIFIDETWQKVNGVPIGALGAVALPQKRYNHFSRQVYRLKADVLGASEFTDAEIKGTDVFTKAAFKREALHGDSYMLKAANEMFKALRKHKAAAFVIWTKNPSLLTLRNPTSTALSKPYRQLLFDLRAYMRNEAGGKLASINFDERGHREDEATARAVSNFLIRTSGKNFNRWDRNFLTIPSFTASSISPGLQAADMISFLGAHRSDPTARPELNPYVQQLLDLRYEYQRTPKQRVRCVREIV